MDYVLDFDVYVSETSSSSTNSNKVPESKNPEPKKAGMFNNFFKNTFKQTMTANNNPISNLIAEKKSYLALVCKEKLCLYEI